MRLDVYLKKTRLLRQRVLAKQLCDRGEVLCNGHPAKPSQKVALGDRLEIRAPGWRLVVAVVELPRGNVPKNQRGRFFALLEQEKRTPQDHVFDLEEPE